MKKILTLILLTVLFAACSDDDDGVSFSRLIINNNSPFDARVGIVFTDDEGETTDIKMIDVKSREQSDEIETDAAKITVTYFMYINGQEHQDLAGIVALEGGGKLYTVNLWKE